VESFCRDSPMELWRNCETSVDSCGKSSEGGKSSSKLRIAFVEEGW
jgi:hypothetical protein